MKLQILCLGCNYTWSSQPKLDSAKSIGNMMITAATELPGLDLTKIQKQQSGGIV